MSIEFDREEKSANQCLLDYMDIIRDWGLYVNETEMVHAIHTLQMFIIMHMLQRVKALGFSDWYQKEAPKEKPPFFSVASCKDLEAHEDHIYYSDIYHAWYWCYGVYGPMAME